MFQLVPMTAIAIAVAAFLLIVLLQRLPVIGPVVRLAFSVCLIVAALVLLVERAPMSPFLAPFASRLHLDRQEVVGKEVRIPLAASGHFLATVRINGVTCRMLVDTGATMTALSTRTAEAAGLKPDPVPVPVLLQTANGAVAAQTATVPELHLGSIVARDLKVVVSPAFGDMDVLGMNFLSKLASWRVEKNMLVLVPHHPQPVANT